MNNKKSSVIWKMSSDNFVELFNRAKSIGELLSFFGLENKGHNGRTIKKRIAEESLDITQLLARTKIHLALIRKELPNDEMFSTKSDISRTHVKRRILRDNLLEYKCSNAECSVTDMWNGAHISLHLDHINGIPNDNRLENLRFLCPNCHSQTNTYAGKSNTKITKKCVNCGSPKKDNTSKICFRCASRNKRKCLNRPTIQELNILLKTHSLVSIGKMYGVSDNTIRKWINQSRPDSNGEP